MKIDNEFTVSVPIEEAWEAMQDLESIAPCLPGAAITGHDGDDYQGTMTVKIGPITAKYKGTVKFEEKNESAHRAVLNATGRDARGQGTASATISSSMQETSEGTHVSVETDMKLTGKAAQFGRGIAQDVAEKMLGQFAECLEGRLSGRSEGSGETDGTPEETSATTSGKPKSGVADAMSTPANSGATVTPGGAPAGVSSGSNGAGQEASGSLARPVGSATGNGSAASGDSSGAPGGEPKSEPKTRKIEQDEEPEPLDLGEMSQDAVMQRVKPLLIGAGVLVALVWLFRKIRN